MADDDEAHPQRPLRLPRQVPINPGSPFISITQTMMQAAEAMRTEETASSAPLKQPPEPEPQELDKPDDTADAGQAASRGPCKSWRKKYHKMLIKFREVEAANKAIFKDEYILLAKARRLMERNDQLLELIMDFNGNDKLPAHLRFELPEIPGEWHPDDEYYDDPDENGNLILKPKEKREPAPGMKSLRQLLETVPHTDLEDVPEDKWPEDMQGENPPGYFSPDHEEEYLSALDLALESGSTVSSAVVRETANKVIPSERELQLRNPHSVYNWLRRNQPNVFLQDKEVEVSSEKSAKPGRGKRASMAAKGGDQDSVMDDDGSVAGEPASSRGKKVKDDDTTYRPSRSGGKGKRKRESDGPGEKSTDKPAKRKYVRHSAPGNTSAAS